MKIIYNVIEIRFQFLFAVRKGMWITMKKVISMLLSVVMLISMAAGVDFSACADETQTYINICSNILFATDDLLVSYDIVINDELFNGEALNDAGESISIEDGRLLLPAKDSATITVDINSKYKITRNECTLPGYDPIEEACQEGIASNYIYFLSKNNVMEVITYEEYYEQTDNGENTVQFYYENAYGDRYDFFDESIVCGDFYRETAVSEFIEQSVGYKSDELISYPASLSISAKLNERPPATSLGKTTYYYTGTVTLNVGGKIFADSFMSVPSTDVDQAKNTTSTMMLASVRTVAYKAVNGVSDREDTSIYFADSLDAMVPKAQDIPKSETETTIVNNSTSVYEFVAYTFTTYEYIMQESSGITDVVFSGALHKTHTHSYDEIVVEPTCTEQGYTIHVCSCGDEYRDSYTKTVAHSYKETVTSKASAKKAGEITKTCQYCTKTEKVAIPMVKSATLSTTTYKYDGKIKKPTVTVKDVKGKKLVKDKDYTVSYPSGRKNVGTYKVKVTLKGKYAGSFSVSFKIIPKGTTISSLSAKSKGFKVKWKKQSTQTTGYQIQYSTSSKFTSAKSVTVLKNSTTSAEVKKLKAKKKYYVRIRTFKTVNGERHYSAWSKYKTVTTKK